jgi:DNA polymerase III subunit epsilon
LHELPGEAGRPMVLGGVSAAPEDTLLAARAQDFLSRGPAEPVALISYVCNLPGAPRVVAEHMASALFAGRTEFERDATGRWHLRERPVISYTASAPTEPDITRLDYVVVDVETTGGRAYGGDRITEIAAVTVSAGEIGEVYETLVNPQRSIPYYITQLTNITWDMVKDAPTFDMVAPRVLDQLEGRVFVAHNAGFDWRFVTAEMMRGVGRRLTGNRLCTVRLARRLLPQLQRRSLDHVARYYGVEITSRHRAAGDAIATAQCLLRLLHDAADRGHTSWESLDALINAPRTPGKRRRRSARPAPVDRDTTA